MEFSDINFYERSGAKTAGLGRHLPGGYWVQKAYFEITWRQVRAAIPALDWASKPEQSAETLCGEAFWQAQKKGGPRLKLGRCVKYFVDHEMLALRVANPGKKGKRRYTRK